VHKRKSLKISSARVASRCVLYVHLTLIGARFGASRSGAKCQL